MKRKNVPAATEYPEKVIDGIVAIVETFVEVEKDMTNEDICQNLKSGAYTIVSKSRKQKNVSPVWQTFGKIKFEPNSIIKGKVACQTCLLVLNYHYLWGTSNLLAHQESCNKRKNEKGDFPEGSVKNDIRRDVKYDVVKFVCQDLRPFATISGNGFENLIDKAITLGARFGESLTAHEILPHPTTVARAIPEIAKKHREELKDQLMKTKETGFGLTLDIWTNSYSQVSYININAHFFAENELQEQTLCVKSLDEIEKTGANIFKSVSNVLKGFGVDDLSDIIFVTDRGANLKLALVENERLDCAAHILNNIVCKMFKNSDDLNLALTLKESRNLVAYVKKSGVQTKLQSTLKSECLTRWNGE